MISDESQLATRLRHYGLVLRDEAQVSPALHRRIIDRLEARAHPSSYRIWGQLAVVAAMLAVAIGTITVTMRLRSSELAKAAPVVQSVVPQSGAKDVPLKGEFRIKFAARPTSEPRLELMPADGKLQTARWDGATMVVDYSGLHPSHLYDVVLTGEYRSRLGDRGHFEKRWSFTAQGPAQLTALSPSDGATDVARNGNVSLQFARRPVVDPLVRIQPAAKTMQPGGWKDATWTVAYTGLQPLQVYKVTVDVELGDPAANFHREWSFRTEPGAPPAGVPLVWYAPSNPWDIDDQGAPLRVRLLGLDWSGKLVGTLYQDGPIRQAPDGSRLLVGIGYVTESGALVAPASAGKGSPVFSDDSRHVCALLDSTGGNPGALEGKPTWLFTGAIGSSLHRVAQAGRVGGQSGPSVAACSYLSDRAVVVENVVAYASELWVFRLTTGALLYHHVYSPGSVDASIVATHDGRYIAEQTNQTDAQGRAVYGGTLIRRTSDGLIVARLAGQSVLAFSWDGGRVVTTAPWGSTLPNQARLVDWQSGRTFWRLPVQGNVSVNVLTKPGGMTMVIGVGHQDSSGSYPVAQLYLVQADGAARQIASGPLYPAF
jgi:hypothetical protein